MSESGVVYKQTAQVPALSPVEHQIWRRRGRRIADNNTLHNTEKTKTNYANLLRILSLADAEDFNGEDGMGPLARPFLVDA